MSGLHDKQDCLAMAERLSEYIDQELPSELQRELLTHIEDCADCVRFVESLRRVKDLARWLEPPELPSDRLSEIARQVALRLDDGS